ncbi:MAG: imidazoleglycerol-phosphate dehydratase HisB [Candidatus Geothermincolia bacterium]
MTRTASVDRKTKETSISLKLDLDGSGAASVKTGISFLDHMLTLLARHALIDLELEASGDLEVDQHHTVEDIGITLGQALKQALGDKAGINRYGFALLPMDEALCMVAMDLSGRSFCAYRVDLELQLLTDFDPSTTEEFLRALANEAALTLHVNALEGSNGHHILESIFKGLGRALRMAVEKDPRSADIPSTKGTL